MHDVVVVEKFKVKSDIFCNDGYNMFKSFEIVMWMNTHKKSKSELTTFLSSNGSNGNTTYSVIIAYGRTDTAWKEMTFWCPLTLFRSFTSLVNSRSIPVISWGIFNTTSLPDNKRRLRLCKPPALTEFAGQPHPNRNDLNLWKIPYPVVFAFTLVSEKTFFSSHIAWTHRETQVVSALCSILKIDRPPTWLGQFPQLIVAVTHTFCLRFPSG